MLSLTDAIIECGRFYTMYSFTRGLVIGLHDILFDNRDSDTSHLASEAAFHGLITYFHKALLNICPDFTIDDANGKTGKLKKKKINYISVRYLNYTSLIHR